MGKVVDAAQTFFENLADVRWEALALALGCHLLRLLVRVPAWRNIIRASYPESVVPRRAILGGYFAGIGVNAVVPVRGGDLLRLYIVRHRVEGSTYPTLGSTLLAETLFDMVVALAVIAWALTLGVLPGLDVLPDLPQIEWGWPLRHPKAAIAIGAVWFVVLVLFAVIAIRRFREFKERVRLGFAILRPFSRYLRQVVPWQALSWGLRFASVYFFLDAFGMPATAHNAILVLVVQSLSTALPFTPGGIGTQQGLLAFIFREAAPQTSTTLVVSFSVGMHIAMTVANVLVGFAAILAMLRTVRWRRVVAPEEERAYGRRS